MRSMISHKLSFFVLCFVLVVSNAVIVQANTAFERSSAKVPSLLVMRVAETVKGKDREDRFVEEFSMVMDQLPVRLVVSPNAEGLAKLSMGDQVKIVRSISAQENAPAVVWISESDQDVLLHVMVMKTSKILIRLLKADNRDGFEKDLALAATELFGLLLLFDAPPKDANDLFVKAVEDGREQVVTSSGFNSSFSILTAGKLDIGAIGGAGPRWFGGGSLSLEIGITKDLFGRFNMDFGAGPFDVVSYGVKLKTLSLAPGVGLIYLWEHGIWFIGPALDLQIFWTQMIIETESVIKQVIQTTQFRASAVLESRWNISSHVSFLIGAGILATPQRDRFRLEHTKETVFATWNIGLAMRLGVLFH